MNAVMKCMKMTLLAEVALGFEFAIEENAPVPAVSFLQVKTSTGTGAHMDLNSTKQDKVVLDSLTENCPDCNGNGSRMSGSWECGTCEGTGQVPRKVKVDSQLLPKTPEITLPTRSHTEPLLSMTRQEPEPEPEPVDRSAWCKTEAYLGLSYTKFNQLCNGVEDPEHMKLSDDVLLGPAMKEAKYFVRPIIIHAPQDQAITHSVVQIIAELDGDRAVWSIGLVGNCGHKGSKIPCVGYYNRKSEDRVLFQDKQVAIQFDKLKVLSSAAAVEVPYSKIAQHILTFYGKTANSENIPFSFTNPSKDHCASYATKVLAKLDVVYTYHYSWSFKRLPILSHGEINVQSHTELSL